ncbi:MAG TPA: glycosyltransferase family 4 protein [Candidatus Moranbacteria bacterium]|nr:glycosyltransferase family 4 protein [Candidatus Moranbacteria bacterium]HSA08409.1 glycosyltransferase family 4 protein [Candidatus Moranbacteria bacterium]
MKILFFNYEFPPLGGGAGNASYYLLREYSKNPNIKVDFITSSIDEKQHLERIGNNITIHRLPIGKNPENIHYQSQKELLKYTWEAYRFSKKLAKENKYDLTHSFFSVPCGVISLLLKRKFRIPYIISLRGSDVPGYSERFTALYKIITPIIKKVWREAYFVIANSQGLAELSLKSSPEKEIGIIPNGIDIEEFFPDLSKKNKDQFTIICVSRVTPRKGIRFLIQAFNVLSRRYDYIKLVIVGDGNERASLEDLVQALGLKEKVLFTGPVLHEKVLGYYQKANIFALPSMNEGMSNTMLEALACGLPLVATDTGGTKELIEDGQNGFIVKMKESHDLAEKIEKFLLNRNLEKEMGQKSRELAEKLDWSVVANKYIDLYDKTVRLRKIKQGE